MSHYNDNNNDDWEFEWVEDSMNFAGNILLRGLSGLSYVLWSICDATVAQIKEKTKK